MTVRDLVTKITNNRPPAPNEVPTTVIRPSSGWADLGLRDVWEYRELLYFMIWREERALPADHAGAALVYPESAGAYGHLQHGLRPSGQAAVILLGMALFFGFSLRPHLLLLPILVLLAIGIGLGVGFTYSAAPNARLWICCSLGRLWIAVR